MYTNLLTKISELLTNFSVHLTNFIRDLTNFISLILLVSSLILLVSSLILCNRHTNFVTVTLILVRNLTNPLTNFLVCGNEVTNISEVPH